MANRNLVVRHAVCVVEGCDRPVYIQKRGLCTRHYSELRKNTIGRLSMSPEERFWLYVNRSSGRFVLDTECWEWTGGTRGDYGVFENQGAHCWAWELENGPIPEGLEIDHLCRVRLCVRHSHLEPVTKAENARRAAQHRLLTHCHQGHPLSGDNLYLRPNGRRECRECSREAVRRYRRRQESRN